MKKNPPKKQPQEPARPASDSSVPSSEAPATGQPTSSQPDTAEPSSRGNFFEQLASIAHDEWDFHRIYLYRLWPVIDRGQDRHFIAKVSHPIDEAEVLETHGSGRYHAVCNNTRERKRAASETFSVYDPAFPPKVDPGHVVRSDPANEPYFSTWAKPKAVKETQAGESKKTTNGDGTKEEEAAAKAAVHEIADLARTVIKGQEQSNSRSAVDSTIADLWSKTAEQRDALAKELSTAAGKTQDPLQMLTAVLALVEKLNRHSPAPASTSPSDPLAMLDRALDLLTKVKGFTAGAGQEPAANREPESGWTAFLNALSPALGQFMQPLGRAVAQRLLQPPDARTTVRTPTTNAVSRQDNVTATDSPAATETQAAAASASPSFESGMIKGVLDTFAPSLINALNLGKTGYDVASAVETMYGGLIYEQIAAIGPVGLLNLLRGHEIWNAIAPIEGRVSQLLQEFVDYGQQEEQPDETEEQTGAEETTDTPKHGRKEKEKEKPKTVAA